MTHGLESRPELGRAVFLDQTMRVVERVPMEGAFWIFCLPHGEMFIPGRREARERTGDDTIPLSIMVDRYYCERMASEYQRALEHWARMSPAGQQRYSPLLLEHGESKDGVRHGDVISLAYAERDDHTGLWALCDPSVEIRRLINAELIKHVSPHIRWRFEDADGEVFAPHLLELSFVANPYLTRLGTILGGGYTLVLSAAHEADLTGEDLMNFAELLETMGQRLDALESKIAELTPDDDAEDGDDETPAPDDAGAEASSDGADDEGAEASEDGDEDGAQASAEDGADDEGAEASEDGDEDDGMAAGADAQVYELLERMGERLGALGEALESLQASSLSASAPRDLLTGNGRPPARPSLDEKLKAEALASGRDLADVAADSFKEVPDASRY